MFGVRFTLPGTTQPKQLLKLIFRTNAVDYIFEKNLFFKKQDFF